MSDELVNAMADLRRDRVFEIVRNEIENDTDPLKIIDWLSQGLKIVGEYFDKKEYFLAELITGGDIFETVYQEIKERDTRIPSSSGSLHPQTFPDTTG